MYTPGNIGLSSPSQPSSAHTRLRRASQALSRYQSLKIANSPEYTLDPPELHAGARRQLAVATHRRRSRMRGVRQLSDLPAKLPPLIAGPDSPQGPYSASKFALEALSEALAQETKMFNVRVSIVQPGIVDTSMARGIRDLSGDSVYPHAPRFAGLFTAWLRTPAPPSLFGQKIIDIIESDTWQLRHPVGPDTEPFLEWRASMTDEQWIDWGAADDDTWYEGVERDFGLNAPLQE